MYRKVLDELIAWKMAPQRKPLIVRGARQIGKSYIVNQLGRAQFTYYVEINFEFEPKYKSCFERFDPVDIINAISLMSGIPIREHETLLFFDEIQECPRAIQSLRYFKEKMPNLHVLAAGSLLEFVINDEEYREPVGRVQSLYMKPCSFNEYLIAAGFESLDTHLANVTVQDGIHEGVHTTLLEHLRNYLFLGGLPEVLSHYIETKDLLQCQRLQGAVLEYYRRDFGKYSKKIKTEYLQAIFDKVPGMVTQAFRYTHIDDSVHSRLIKPALHALKSAGLVYPIHHTSASGLPFNTTINEKKFKCIFIDVGLMGYSTELPYQTLLNNDFILLNRGAIAEQFVGQELLANEDPYRSSQLYYWHREEARSQAEVDYVIHVDQLIIPLEVKSGKTGSLRSLQLFLNEKSLPLGVRISQKELSYDGRVLTVPLYMVREIPRLVREISDGLTN